MGVGAPGVVAESVDDLGCRRQVRASDAEGDDVVTLGVEPSNLTEFGCKPIFFDERETIGGSYVGMCIQNAMGS